MKCVFRLTLNLLRYFVVSFLILSSIHIFVCRLEQQKNREEKPRDAGKYEGLEEEAIETHG